MPVITLTTDFGTRDHYLPRLKAYLVSHSPQANLVDISHEIAKFDLLEASFLLGDTWQAFPEGTIHLISVNGSTGEDAQPVLVRFRGHYFLGTDNGLISLIVGDEQPDVMRMISQDAPASFPALQVLAPVAIEILNGKEPSAIGTPLQSIVRRKAMEAFTDQDSITGRVTYLDSYENAITNISRRTFDDIGQGRDFVISLKQPRKYGAMSGPSDNQITALSATYSDVPEGEVLAMFNVSGLLEIAINKGNAGGLLGLRTGEMVRITFL